MTTNTLNKIIIEKLAKSHPNALQVFLKLYRENKEPEKTIIFKIAKALKLF